MTGPLSRPALLYDGGCRLCRWAARVVFSLDRRQALAFLPLDDPGAAALLAPLADEERLATWRLVEPDGRLLDRGAAGAALLQHLGARRLGALAGRRTAALGSAYELVARNRSRLGRLVPDGPAPRRFP